MALLNPGAVKKKVNTSSGGQAVYLTPEQQQKVAGTAIGAKLGVTTPTAPTRVTTTTGGTTVTPTTPTVNRSTAPTVNRAPRVLGTSTSLGAPLPIDRSLGIKQDPMSAYASYFSPEYTIDRQKDIFKEVERARQSQIDAINLKYQSQVQTEQQAGQEDLARQRSMNLRAGLGGSDFGAAAKSQVRDRTNQRVASIQANQDIAVGNVISEIEQLAQQRFQSEQNALHQGFTNALNYEEYKNKQDDAFRTKALSNLTNLAKLDPNLSVVDIANRDPQLYESIRNATNMTDFEIDAYLAANNGVKTEQVWKGDTLVMLKQDAQGNILGKQTYSAEELGIPVGTDFTTITDETTGMVYWYDKSPNAERNSDGTPKLLKMGKFALSQYEERALALSGRADGGEVSDQLYGGLSSTTATAVRSQVSKFSSDPVVKNFATIQEGYDFASSIPDNTTNSADDQALIYALAKALDPGSVVREGEYATAQKYAQSWVNAFGKGVEQALTGQGFLSQQARANIKKTIEQRYEASKRSYDSLYNNYTSNINSLTGRNDGSQFLVDYATPVSGGGNDTVAQIAQYFGYDYNALKNQGNDRDILLALVQANNKSGAQYNFDNYTDQQIQDALLKAIAQKEGVTR